MIFSFKKNKHATPKNQISKIIAKISGFGGQLTNYMSHIHYENGNWINHEIIPVANLSLPPSTSCFHYGQEIFEGLKAYKDDQGKIYTFRIKDNAKRFQDSAKRIGLPILSISDFCSSITQLLMIEKDWIPTKPGASLYIRPFMIATDASVGLKNCTVADYYVIVLPVTAYIATAVATIWIEQKYHRAAPGGTGYAKCGGNYAASLYPKHLAYEKKCNEVLYLDAKTNSFIEEFSGMSFFMVKKNCLYTPKISDTILDSITRKSIIQIAKDLKIKVFQTDIKLNNFLADVKSKRVTEVFACGTAAVVTPVGFFKSTKFKNLIVNNGKEGPITAQLKKQLLQIQKGIIADKYKWVTINK